MCTDTGHSVRGTVKYVRKQASPCSPWETPETDTLVPTELSIHMVGVMKGLTAKPSHQQRPPLLQALAWSPYPQIQPWSPDSHSRWSWYMGKQSSPASQWPHTAELCGADRGSGACNSQHSLWPAILVANAHIKVPEKPLLSVFAQPKTPVSSEPQDSAVFPK